LDWVKAMDRLDKATRSRIMSRIRGSGNRTTEWRLRAGLVRAGVRGWNLGTRSDLPGRPDFVFGAVMVAVFVDGCFWHGCSRCGRGRAPRTNANFWRKKIVGNAARDRRQNATLRRRGWTVLRIWEHQLAEKIDGVLGKIHGAIESKKVRVKHRRSSIGVLNTEGDMANFKVVVQGGHVDIEIPQKGQVRVKGGRILAAKPNGKKWYSVKFEDFVNWAEQNGRPGDH